MNVEEEDKREDLQEDKGPAPPKVSIEADQDEDLEDEDEDEEEDTGTDEEHVSTSGDEEKVKAIAALMDELYESLEALELELDAELGAG